MKSIKLYFINVLLLFIFMQNTHAQNNPYPNISFEAGDFSNWQCFKGPASSSGFKNTDDSSIFANPVSGASNGYQSIYPHPPPCLPINGCNNNEIDFCGGFSKRCPFAGAGKFAAVLNDENGGGLNSGVNYNIHIPANKNIFKIFFYYAAGFADQPHQEEDQPRFEVNMFDSATNTPLQYGLRSYNPDNIRYNDSIFYKQWHSTKVGGQFGDPVLWKEWTQSTLVIKNMAGKAVSLHFLASDCVPGAHFGYAYVDINPNFEAYNSDTISYCSNISSLPVNLPPGYKHYTIMDGANNIIQQQDSNNLFTLTPPPPIGANLKVILTPYTGFGSQDTITYTTTLAQPTIVSNNISGCSGLVYNNKSFTTSTTLTDTLKTKQGCDSVYNVTNITINNFEVGGNIIYPNKKPIPNVLINAADTTTNLNSGYNGLYDIGCLSKNFNNTFRLKKKNEVLKTNGVSVQDIALIQSHILHQNNLNSPYKIIAADVNGDGRISALDLIYLRRFILGLDTTFENKATGEKSLWTFVDSSYSFPNPNKPFPYKDSISINGLTGNELNHTFIGIKLGDVNWDWNPALAKPASFKMTNKLMLPNNNPQLIDIDKNRLLKYIQ